MILDTSPEQLDFEEWCAVYSQRHLARTCSLYEALEVFRAELPELCLSKVSADENAEAFKDLLQKLRRWAANPEGLNIARAKQYPIMRLAEELTGGAVRFHKIQRPGERTASIHLYEESNRWHDFGLNKNGDTVDLLMLFTNLPFKEAVRRLS